MLNSKQEWIGIWSFVVLIPEQDHLAHAVTLSGPGYRQKAAANLQQWRFRGDPSKICHLLFFFKWSCLLSVSLNSKIDFRLWVKKKFTTNSEPHIPTGIWVDITRQYPWFCVKGDWIWWSFRCFRFEILCHCRCGTWRTLSCLRAVSTRHTSRLKNFQLFTNNDDVS